MYFSYSQQRYRFWGFSQGIMLQHYKAAADIETSRVGQVTKFM
jgi:hypothetical protein